MSNYNWAVEAICISVGRTKWLKGARSFETSTETGQNHANTQTNKSHRKRAIKRWAARQWRYYQKSIKNALKCEEEQKHGIFFGPLGSVRGVPGNGPTYQRIKHIAPVAAREIPQGAQRKPTTRARREARACL
jgi:hypothetical protein